MDVDLLTAKAKWAVLEKIAKNELSPLEIAKQLHTSVANVSTQLRYLELANIVKKRRVPNAMAGMPRVLYSLNKSVFVVMAAAEGFSMRKIIDMDEEKELFLQIWQLPKAVHGPLIHFAVRQSQLFTDKNDVYFSEHGDNVIKIVVCNQKNPLPPKIVSIPYKDQSVAVDVRFINVADLAKERRLVRIHRGNWA